MNYEFARENMIKQQVLPEGIPNDLMVEAMSIIPRENFLPDKYKKLAYCDTGFAIEGKSLKSPVLVAKLINALGIKTHETVLKLALETGYTAALLAKISASVEILDYSDEALGLARRKLADLDIYNVEFSSAEHLTNIVKNNKKYDCLYISNVVEEGEIDASLFDLLDNGGRAVFMIRNSFCDKVYLVTRLADDSFKREFIFDVYNK